MLTKLRYIVAAIFIFFATGIATYFFLSVSNIFVKGNAPTTDTYTNSTPLPTPKMDSAISILLLGYGGAGHPGGTLTDVMMLVHINYKEKKVNLISVPRDLWVNLPIQSDKTEYFKINMAHAIGVDNTNYPLKETKYKNEAGGGMMAMEAVEKVTGIPVDYFVSVDFQGFSDAVDLLGGIDVIVPESFTDHFYPVKGLENETCGFTAEEITEFHQKYSGFELEKQFTCRYETLEFQKGPTHLDGPTALKFVRSRHSDTGGGDFARSARQQAILESLREKAISMDAFKNSKSLLDKFSSTFRTDINLEAIEKLKDLLGDLKDYEVRNINLTTDNVLANSRSSGGAYILIPKEGIGNWDGVKSHIQKELTN